MGYIEAYGSKCTLRTAFGTWVFEATTYKGRDASLRTGIPFSSISLAIEVKVRRVGVGRSHIGRQMFVFGCMQERRSSVQNDEKKLKEKRPERKGAAFGKEDSARQVRQRPSHMLVCTPI